MNRTRVLILRFEFLDLLRSVTVVLFLLPRIIADSGVQIVARTAAAVHVITTRSAVRGLFLSSPPPHILLKTSIRRNHLPGAETIDISLNKKKIRRKLEIQI